MPEAEYYDLLNSTAVYAHPSGITEQTVVTFTPTRHNVFKGIWLDLVNLTQNATIRLQYQIDATNYRTVEPLFWTTGDEDGVLVKAKSAIRRSVPIRVTLQSAVAEGVSRNIPYELWYKDLGAVPS